MKDASRYRTNRIVFDSDSDAETAAAADGIADVIEQSKPALSNKQVHVADYFQTFHVFMH